MLCVSKLTYCIWNNVLSTKMEWKVKILIRSSPRNNYASWYYNKGLPTRPSRSGYHPWKLIMNQQAFMCHKCVII